MDYIFSENVKNLKASAIREILKFSSLPGFISFAAGNPSQEAVPCEAVAKITADIMQNDPITALQYSVTEGYTPLKNHLKKYCKEKYGIGSEGDGIIITSGAQQVMDLAAKSLCNVGDTVITEDPSFIGTLNCFRSYGLKLKGVPVESDGMNMQALEQALKENKNARFIYTIPNFQNPSGATMSLEKRKTLYSLAKKYSVIVIEDNPYGDLRFEGEDIPAIKTLDADGIVIYAGSFSKVLSPGMRVGYAIAPDEILGKMTVCKQTQDVHTNILAQMIAYRFMTEYDFEAHLAHLREIYRKKSSFMLGFIDTMLKEKGVTRFPVHGGLFVWCALEEGIDMEAFCKKAAENKVGVVPGSAFLTDPSAKCQSFRLNYSTPSDEEIEKGMKILYDLL